MWLYSLSEYPTDFGGSQALQVIFPVGSLSFDVACTNVSINEDSISEGNEDFTIELNSTSIGMPVVMFGTHRQQKATILDNDG